MLDRRICLPGEYNDKTIITHKNNSYVRQKDLFTR